MRTEDLFLKYAQVINMCEGTKVKPWEGVKYLSAHFDCHPAFDATPCIYEFMVGVLEDRPVFVGDKVYHEGCPDAWYKVHEKAYSLRDEGMQIPCDWDKSVGKAFTWNPPKKTFALNGEELPCPQKDYSTFNLDLNSWGPYGRKNGSRYYFKSESDLDAAIKALHKLLQDATK